MEQQKWNIIWHSAFFFVFLIVVQEPLHKCSAYVLPPLLYNIHLGCLGGPYPPLKLIGNLVAKSLLELFSNKVYKEL